MQCTPFKMKVLVEVEEVSVVLPPRPASEHGVSAKASDVPARHKYGTGEKIADGISVSVSKLIAIVRLKVRDFVSIL